MNAGVSGICTIIKYFKDVVSIRPDGFRNIEIWESDKVRIVGEFSDAVRYHIQNGPRSYEDNKDGLVLRLRDREVEIEEIYKGIVAKLKR